MGSEQPVGAIGRSVGALGWPERTLERHMMRKLVTLGVGLPPPEDRKPAWSALRRLMPRAARGVEEIIADCTVDLAAAHGRPELPGDGPCRVHGTSDRFRKLDIAACRCLSTRPAGLASPRGRLFRCSARQANVALVRDERPRSRKRPDRSDGFLQRISVGCAGGNGV